MIYARISLILLLMPALARAQGAAPAATGPQAQRLFNPARHMRTEEVREGMTGYGLTVFRGTTIERFNVTVLAVLHNVFGPSSDVVLIDCNDPHFAKSGVAAGMSGSPIFLKDDQGRHRMIGALAYGFPFTTAPIAGVQPIEAMLDGASTIPAQATDTAMKKPGPATRPVNKAQWRLEDLKRPAVASGRTASIQLGARSMHLSPLASPLMMSGVPQHVMKQFTPVFGAWDMVPLQAGNAGKAAPGSPPAKLEPGSVLAVPLIVGDIETVVLGTCTEVIGDTVVAFGHQMNNEGPINLPMATGRVSAIVPNLQSSFKIGSMEKVVGTATADQHVGVTGRIGAAPPMIPMTLRVQYTDGSMDKTYRLQVVGHPKLTAAAVAAAIQSLIAGPRDLPQYHTLDYDLSMEFANGKTVRIDNCQANVQGGELMQELSLPITAAAENPFASVMLKSIQGTIKVSPKARLARILAVQLPRTRYQPGETAKIFVTYRPFREEEAVMSLEFEIPRDLADGTYQFSVSDWDAHIEQERQARPFRFTAESVDEIFAILKDVYAIRHDAIYIRLNRQSDGVAIGRTAMARLPGSRRQIMLGAGQSNTTPFVSSIVKTLPMPMLMDGSASFSIVIERESKLDSGGGKGPLRSEPKAPLIPIKPDDVHPKPLRAESPSAGAESSNGRNPN